MHQPSAGADARPVLIVHVCCCVCVWALRCLDGADCASKSTRTEHAARSCWRLIDTSATCLKRQLQWRRGACEAGGATGSRGRDGRVLPTQCTPRRHTAAVPRARNSRCCLPSSPVDQTRVGCRVTEEHTCIARSRLGKSFWPLAFRAATAPCNSQ